LPPPPSDAKRVERPFVAIWVEDSDGKPVRTVTVWGNQRKWLKELSSWWSFAKDQQQLISNTTRATRPAGKYQVVWDGLGDDGKPVSKGTYTLVLEVSREFGSHEIHRGTIECGDLSSDGTIPGAREFLDCPLAYRPPSS
jgi:FAD:protein FMN transferase